MSIVQCFTNIFRIIDAFSKKIKEKADSIFIYRYTEMNYNAIVGQSGGPTSAINATLAGVISEAMKSKVINTLYGAKNGIDGIISENLVNLTDLFSGENSADDLDLLKTTPAAALGSCRHKLPRSIDDDINGVYANLFDVFKKYNIGYFFYIGGNDSMDTVMKLNSVAKAFGADHIRFIGVPKTIDNDLCETDHTPGYGSAAKYIASVMQGILYDCAVYTVRSVTIVEIMGRDSGWLTCTAALPRLNGRAPDFVYLPEVDFDNDKFINDIKKAHETHPNVVVAVSEGIRYSDGRYVGESNQSGATDVFGHKYLAGAGKTLEQLVKSELGCKVRSFELSLPQRSASFCLSLCDIEESFGVGSAAVKAAEKGESGVLLAYFRSCDPNEYKISYKSIDIEKAANRVKTVPIEFITPEHNNVTDACLKYISPMLIGEPKLKYMNGIPVHYIIK